jgi:hypothetical protein
MMSSVGPSLKYSWSGSRLMLVKGRTTIEGFSGTGGLTGGPLTPATSISKPSGRGQTAQSPTPTSSSTAAVVASTVQRRRSPLPASASSGVSSAPAPSLTNAVAKTIGSPTISNTTAKPGTHSGRPSPETRASTPWKATQAPTR